MNYSSPDQPARRRSHRWPLPHLATALRLRCPRSRCGEPPARSGMSILIVLGLLAITLAISYAMMRTQFTNIQIHQNYERRGDARQAAYAGLSVALREMQQATWGGVAAPLARQVGADQSFVVTYATGDDSLVPGTPEYDEFPYRVTITSQGIVTDPATEQVYSTHTVRAVVQLVRRKLTDPPATWSELQSYTLYQWGTGNGEGVALDVPVRVEGPVMARGELDVAPSYPYDGDDVAFAGNIDEVVILRRALSDSTIQNLATSAVTLNQVVTTYATDVAARWRFDEAANALLADDAAGASDGLYDGAQSGGSPSPSFGGTGSAVFDGYHDQVHLDNLSVSGSAMTILAWIRPTSFPSNFGRVVSKTDDHDASAHDWMLGTYWNGTNQRLRFRLRTSYSGTQTLVASSGNLTADTWVFAAAVYNGITARLYKDGTLVAVDLQFGSISNSTTLPVSIGHNPPGSPRGRLLRDWYSKFAYEGIDRRPLSGPVTVSAGVTSNSVRALCQRALQLTWNEVAADNIVPLSHPGEVLTYQLYPGGQAYSVTQLGGTLQHQTLVPDPLNNPLGVCYRAGNLDIRDNVHFTGVLIVEGNGGTPDVEIYGDDVQLQPVSLPALDGSSTSVQLPLMLVRDDVRIYDGSSGTLQGITTAWGDCGFRDGSQDHQFTIQGKLLTQNFYAQARSEWAQSDDWWHDRALAFLDQLASNSPVPYFADWLSQQEGLDDTPRLLVQPDSSSPTYHWVDWQSPVFAVGNQDGGLRWTVLEVQEIP